MKLSEVIRGLKVRADGGFTCISPGAILTIEFDEDGFPFVRCAGGGHWLGGQVDGDGDLIGFERV